MGESVASRLFDAVPVLDSVPLVWPLTARGMATSTQHANRNYCKEALTLFYTFELPSSGHGHSFGKFINRKTASEDTSYESDLYTQRR